MSPRPPAANANAAILFAPGDDDAADAAMGREVAEDLLHALARHGGVERLYAVCESDAAGAAFLRDVAEWAPRREAEWIGADEVEKLSPVGALLLPGPGLATHGWSRRRVGAAAYSLCGLLRSTAAPRALDAITELLTAPVEPWDALVCPSRAVRSMVSSLLEEQLIFLEERFGRLSQVRPQLPIIPPGVDAAACAFTPRERQDVRDVVGVAEDAVALLFAGRLSPSFIAHPMPMFLAAAMAAARARAPLHLLLTGAFERPEVEASFREAAEMVCPDVRLSVIDIQAPERRLAAFACADIFVSPADTLQDTPGLALLEAMASGLPVIAGEWNGSRDMVRHGVDGLLIRTWAPAAGHGADIAAAFGAGTLGHAAYVAAASQATALDVQDLAEAILVLADSPDERARMGEAGRARAISEFDWSRVIAEHQDLWTDLAARRKRAPYPTRRANFHPARPDPFRAFASYPTGFPQPGTRVRVGFTAPAMIPVLLASPLITAAGRALPDAHRLAGLVATVESGATTADRLIDTQDPGEAGSLWRGLGWLAKYGFVQLEP